MVVGHHSHCLLLDPSDDDDDDDDGDHRDDDRDRISIGIPFDRSNICAIVAFDGWW